jgi:AAA15 family ATPase/GTPase
MSEIQLQPLFLTKFLLKGYKSIINCEFELKKGLNIIIGKNGAGKSNLFEFIQNIVSGFPEKVNFESAEFELLTNKQKKFGIIYKRIILETEFLKTNPNSRFQISRQFYIDGNKKSDGLLDGIVIDPINYEGKQKKLGLNIFHFFFDIGYVFPVSINLCYHLPNPLSFINESGNLVVNKNDNFWRVSDTLSFIRYHFFYMEIGFLNLDNVSLNSFEEYFKNKIKIKQEVLENLKVFSPIQNCRFNENILIYENEINFIIENLKLEFYVNDSWLPWSQLSDGTKRLFYLITEITTKETGLILIEEPELGIHPHQFSLLMDFIKQESETKQILISTHSPKALDHLNKDELGNILIASYEKGKGTQVRNLSIEEKEHATKYMEDVGFLSDFWLYSDLEE